MSTRIGNKIVSGNNAVHKANVSLDNITSAGKEQIIVHVNENSTELALPLATESTVGGVKVDGATISITEDGTISANVPEIDTSELALKSELDAKQDAGDYALRSELPDVSNLATKDEIPTVITSYNDLTDKPTIPSAYTLPTASTSTLGGVKVDGETIKITNGVISAESSGGGDYSIVEAHVNGTSGYNLYANGYCEQWGRVTTTGSGINYRATITLSKPYKNANYNILGFGITTSTDAGGTVYSQSASSFVLAGGLKVNGTLMGGTDLFWKTCGYVS